MIATKPTNARFVRRPVKPALSRRAISVGDLATAMRLAGSLIIAWLVPQRFWPSLARKTSWLGGFLKGKSMAPVTSRMMTTMDDKDGTQCAKLATDLRGARYEVAFQCLRGYRPGGWHPEISVEGCEYIDTALQSGKGCVIWVAHFVFSPNIAKVGLGELGYRVAHLSRPDHGFSSTRFGIRFLNPLRSHFEDTYLSERIGFDRAHPAAALLRARRIVAENGIVSFTAGAWEGSSLVEADYLGHRARLAMGPVWLARKSGATLLPVFALRTSAPDSFIVHVGNPIDVYAAPAEPESMEAAATDFLMQHEP